MLVLIVIWFTRTISCIWEKKCRRLLLAIFNSFLVHAYLPKDLLRREIRPILESGKVRGTLSNNYRPVMNSSSIFKLFEYCIQPVLTKHLRISANQFGFRKQTSCQNAIIFLKETVPSYTSEGSKVHCAFTDMSKAFDKLQHSLILTKIDSTSVPISIKKNYCVNAEKLLCKCVFEWFIR